jgi:uncharacterized zinc-type alcohol dehydrogenase-like protein
VATCEWWRRGEEHLFAKGQPTCVGRNGCYSEAVRVPRKLTIRVPEILESENVAPRLYAGITAYNTLCDPVVRPSCRVRIIGIGGLEQIELRFACLFGADVTAFSTSNDKEDEAGRLRANHLVYTLKTNAMKKVAGSFDFLLSTFTADQNWQSYVNALRPNGTFCFVGAPPSPATLHIFPLVRGQRSVVRQLNGKPK